MWNLGLCQCDHKNRLIPLSVITLSGFHCIRWQQYYMVTSWKLKCWLFFLGKSLRCNWIPVERFFDSSVRGFFNYDSSADVLPAGIASRKRLDCLDNSRHFVERKRQKHFHSWKVRKFLCILTIYKKSTLVYIVSTLIFIHRLRKIIFFFLNFFFFFSIWTDKVKMLRVLKYYYSNNGL